VSKLWSLGPIKYREHGFGIPIFSFQIIGSSLISFC
jgi:hypothetical protein